MIRCTDLLLLLLSLLICVATVQSIVLGQSPPIDPAQLADLSFSIDLAFSIDPDVDENAPIIESLAKSLNQSDARAVTPQPFYNLLSAQEEPTGGALVRVKSSSQDVGLMVYGRIAIDSVTSNGRLLAPYGYIFLGPDTPESQWSNVISARQSTLGFLFTGPNIGSFKTLARYETYFLSSVADANVYGLAQYFLYAKLINDD